MVSGIAICTFAVGLVAAEGTTIDLVLALGADDNTSRNLCLLIVIVIEVGVAVGVVAVGVVAAGVVAVGVVAVGVVAVGVVAVGVVAVGVVVVDVAAVGVVTAGVFDEQVWYFHSPSGAKQHGFDVGVVGTVGGVTVVGLSVVRGVADNC